MDAATAGAAPSRLALDDGACHSISEGVAILGIRLDELGGQHEAIATRVAHFDGVGVLDASNALGPIVGATGCRVERRG